MNLTNMQSCVDNFNYDEEMEGEDAIITSLGLPNLEAQLLVKQAGVITTLEKQFNALNLSLHAAIVSPCTNKAVSRA